MDLHKEWHSLMHHFNEASLKICFYELDGRKAVGADKVDKEQYRERLDSNLRNLVTRMKDMAYKPCPVKQVQIPKEGKKKATRLIGISNLEDKIVQKMMSKILNSIYEPIFSEQSYGFRQNRSCHDAIKALDKYLYKHKIQTIIDVDLENYFSTIDHRLLEEILRDRIKDEKFIRYIIRMFKAGVLQGKEFTKSDEGVAQGSIVSPILSNIYAHEVIDKWFAEVVKLHCKGKVEMFRYADDLRICCQYSSDAERIKSALGKRLHRYKLKMNMDKTNLIPFSKVSLNRGEKQGRFDFLGFTFYWGKSKKGNYIVKLSTSSTKIRAKLKKVNEWSRAIRNRIPLKQIWKIFCSKIRGHIQYYGVSHNIKKLEVFLYKAKRILFKWLNRRSQRKSMTWKKYGLFIEQYPLPSVKIHHLLF